MKTGILLVNLGTPDSASVADVRKYLREFLMDKRVIDISAIGRWLLINLIIAPFRSPNSAKEYRQLFDDRGSPLKYHTQDAALALQQRLGEDYIVSYAMRYQSPSIQSVLEDLKDKVVSLHVIPLFPQYASASTGSAIEKVMEVIKKWQVIPSIRFTSNFVTHPLFIESLVAQGTTFFQQQQYDHVLFSYHGLPERQIKKASVGGCCQLGNCCNSYHSKNHFCYRAQCFETTRSVASRLGLEENQYTVCFQSRLGKTPWIQPYTDFVLEDLASKKIKNVLVFSPAFVADCLETTIEIGKTYKEKFLSLGGERWDLVPSLNVTDKWIDCLYQLAK